MLTYEEYYKLVGQSLDLLKAQVEEARKYTAEQLAKSSLPVTPPAPTEPPKTTPPKKSKEEK